MNKEQIQQKFEDTIKGLGFTSWEDGMVKNICICKEDLIELLETGFNLGLEVAADNADADYTIIDENEPDDPVLKEQIEVYVIKNSILKHKL